MNIKEAILTGRMCEDCRYYEYCDYNRDCIAMEFLKEVANIGKNIPRNNTDKGDQ